MDYIIASIAGIVLGSTFYLIRKWLLEIKASLKKLNERNEKFLKVVDRIGSQQQINTAKIEEIYPNLK